jgi:hypothetical protein
MLPNLLWMTRRTGTVPFFPPCKSGRAVNVICFAVRISQCHTYVILVMPYAVRNGYGASKSKSLVVVIVS